MTRSLWLALVAAAIPAAAAAQSSVSGSVEYTVADSTNTNDGLSSRNGAVWQNYALGFHSFVVDPRLLKYDTELTYRTNHLVAGGDNLADQQGRQHDLGFRVGAFVLPSGVFPIHVQASRIFGATNGELAASNPVRGSLGLQQPGDATSFDTENRDLTLDGQLNVPGWPRAEVSYRRGESIVSGGALRADQQNSDLAAGLMRDTSRTRQSLRYQRQGYDYALAQTFTQQVANLDYDFTGQVASHVRVTARAGQRGASTRSGGFAPVDDGGKPYEPPPGEGHTRADFASSGIDYEPSARVSMRLHGSWDQQHSPLGATDATLATAAVRVEPLRGLALNASATGGERGQDLAGRQLRVTTASGVAGVMYTGGPRWLNGTVGTTMGQGRNVTPEGQRGRTNTWSRDVNLSSTLGWFGAGAGYERVYSRDEILDFGNYDSQRLRGSLTLQSARLSLTTSAEQLQVARGQASTEASSRQQTLSATLSARVWRDLIVNATGGEFATSREAADATRRSDDHSTFWGAGAQAAFRRSLRLVAWVRDEDVRASATGFTQRGLNALARLEYRLRAINLALEYRHTDGLVRYATAPLPSQHRGHQLRFSITRQFGFKV